MNELALFAGAGGGILGGKLLGWRTVCAVEYEPHAAAILAKRQNDGILEPFPIWDDVRTFDGKPWQGIVDVVSGGFPCQDISSNGKGAGIRGKRSGLWAEMSRIIGEVRPRYVLVENSPMLTIRGLGTVLGDLAEMGFDAKWGCIGADAAGFPHHRARFWMVAYANVPNSRKVKIQPGKNKKWRNTTNIRPVAGNKKWMDNGNAWKFFPEPELCRKSDGMADGMDRYARIGNGQVPAVVRLAWDVLSCNNSKE